MNLLDGRLVTERRLTLGLSHRMLARRLGVSSSLIRRLEAGDNHAELTLQFVALLCDALSISMRDLMRADGKVRPARADDIVVEAALAVVGKRLSSQELAHGLGWPLQRVHAAIESLRSRLEQTGVRLNLNGGRYGLQPAAGTLTETQTRNLERSHVANAHISIHEARLLRVVLSGELDAKWVRNATAAQKPVLARLLRLGWIEQHGTRFAPTAAVRFSLPDSTCPREPGDSPNRNRPIHASPTAAKQL